MRGGTRFWQNVVDGDGDLFYTQVDEPYTEVVAAIAAHPGATWIPARAWIAGEAHDARWVSP